MKRLVLLTLLSMQLVSQAAMPDFAAIKDSRARKQAFFNYLLPRVKQINASIKQDRATLKSLDTAHFGSREAQRATVIGKRYGMGAIQDPQQLQQLLERVDVVPPSMVLAQAANESAWGTSRFAKQGSNLFGQWCYQKGCGIVPSRRSAGMRHEVRVFGSVTDSIASYMNNLNSNASYSLFRKLRADSRRHDKPITGVQLAQGLEKYSERGLAYVKEIRAMIRFNHLDQLDKTL